MINIYFELISMNKKNFLDYIQNATDIKDNGSPTIPKPPRRELDSSNSTTSRRKVIPVDFDLKVNYEL